MANLTDSFVQSVQALTEALRGALTDPGDQIRLLSSLASFSVASPVGSSPINTGIQTANNATAAICRRAALSSLARACSSYQPTSSTEALTILESITPLYDAEIIAAADAGDTQSYSALRTLRAAVVTDLETRAANLPALIQVTNRIALPVLVAAYQMYGDATRATDLLNRNPDTINPLFFGPSFEALSS